MERFEKDGTWPSHSETTIRSYDQRVPQATFTSSSDVFQNEQRGEVPAQMTLVPWVLYDSGKFREAFELADRIFRDTLEAVREAKAPVSRLRADLVEKYHPAPSLLNQVAFILRRANLVHDSNPGEWSFNLQLHHLDFPLPTLEEMFVKRPTDYSAGRDTVTFSVERDEDIPQKKLTDWVFVGSTWADLGEEFRPKVLQALLSQRMLPLGMEHWSSDSQASIERSLQEIAEANLALFILGERHGSQPYRNDPRSFTEIEYDTAVARGIDFIAFLSADDAAWRSNVLDPSQAKRQKGFRNRVLAGRHVRQFKTPSDLYGEVITALVNWQRGASAAHPGAGFRHNA